MEFGGFGGEVKLEAGSSAQERGAAVAQATCDLDVHMNLLPKCVKKVPADPGHAIPGHRQIAAEQRDIDRLRREPGKNGGERSVTIGNVCDNSTMERPFSSLKTERIGRKGYCTRAQAKTDVFERIACFCVPARRPPNSQQANLPGSVMRNSDD